MLTLYPLCALRRSLGQQLQRFTRAAQLGQGSATLGRRNVYILPTRSGLGYALLLTLLLIGSINYSLGLGYLLTFLLAGLGLVAMLHTWRGVAGLTLQPLRSTPVYAGQVARFPIALVDRAGRARHAIGPESGNAQAVFVDVPADAETLVHLAVDTRRRGWLPLGRLTVHSEFPLGLFRAWAYAELDMRCLVYPRPAPAAQPLPAGGPDRQPGRHGVPGDDDFAGLREHVPGDSLRRVDWKASARAEQLLAKQFEAAQGAALWLDWDATPGTDTEARLAQLTRWVLDAEATGRAWGLRLPGRLHAPDRGEAHAQACLQALALFGEPA